VVFIFFVFECEDWGMGANGGIDQQLGQMYELMQAIRKKELAEGDENLNKPPEAPEKQE
jgi:hypothetical protein